MAGSGARQNRRARRQAFYEVQKQEKHYTPKDTKPQNTIQPIQLAPRTKGQEELYHILTEERFVVAVGPAGCGKTALCVDRAVDLLLDGEVKKIILARPAVSADEDLGFLPGDVNEKMHPYLIPLMDELENKLGGGLPAKAQLKRWIEDGTIEIIPIGFMRGRTFKNAAILLDEMQNCTYSQWRMGSTRMGVGSYMFITGDPTQNDLGHRSGMERAASLLHRNGFPVVYLDESDVVRDPIVQRLLVALPSDS